MTDIQENSEEVKFAKTLQNLQSLVNTSYFCTDEAAPTRQDHLMSGGSESEGKSHSRSRSNGHRYSNPPEFLRNSGRPYHVEEKLIREGIPKRHKQSYAAE